MARAGFVRRFLKPCAVAACLAVLGACGGGGGEPPRTVTTVTVSSPTSTPRQGDTVQLTAVARDQFGDLVPGTTATWFSSAPAVATVSATGLLQALAGGTVTVTATISNVPGSLTLTVTPRVTTTVTVGSPTATPTVGDTVQLTVVARDQFGDVLAGKPATWSTSDAKVATISATGLLQAVAPGTVVATATIEGLPGSLTLTVVPGAAASVTVSSPNATPQAGETVQLTAVVRDRYGNLVPGAAVGWSTSDAKVATISPTGVLQALTPGSVVVTASANGVSGSTALTVLSGAVASVTVSAPTLTPKEGDAVQLTATARDQFGNLVPGLTATWSTSDAGIAAVSATGLLQTYTTGTVQATATMAGVSGTVALTISAIKLSVTIGAKEVVFSYATDRCEQLDSPDQPARFVRAEEGSLVLFAGMAPRNYVSRGADFNSLKRDCRQPALASAERSTPESYENSEWLWAVYREGSRWYALIHNEFHDTNAPTCLSSDPSPVQMCTYNSVTYAVSTDGARSFSKPAPPTHVVAPPPNAWAPPPMSYPSAQYAAVEGYFEPNNIIRGVDGYYYSFMRAVPAQNSRGGQIGMCVMRTNSLDDPASWRAWDGTGFNLRLSSPYVTGDPAQVCTLLKTAMISGQITYNTYLNRYMHVAMAGPYEPDGRPVCGYYVILSVDLIHWSRPQLLAEAQFSWCRVDLQRPTVIEPATVAYASIIDHNDTTTNFERAGRTAHLYYSRLNEFNIPRDLVRVPITFTRVD